jgi:NAD(P)-dependent dehydrogenase (short-subunit alcohol dehydrogenase family)
MKLKDKVAIITGGAQGLGKAYAKRLCEEGAKVVVGDILDGKAFQQEIEEEGGEALALYADVSDEQSVEEMVTKTMERFGKIDILINNAAVFANIKLKPFFEISAQEWDQLMQVNLKGTFLCCKAVYPQMKKQGSGKIINVSSGTFFKGMPYFIHYVTSKGGIIAFSRALAREVGENGISVNVIAPGYTLSDALQETPMLDEKMNTTMLGTRCFKRDAYPEDLTGTIVFLASNESDFITGQTIVVDGGSVMN